MWERLASLVGDLGLLRFYNTGTGAEDTRLAHRDELDARIEAWSRTETVDSIMTALNEAGIPCGRVSSIADLAADPHVAGRRMIARVTRSSGVGQVAVPGSVLSAATSDQWRRPPRLGEHTDEVLAELGNQNDRTPDGVS
jgi:formyl-CoA transferase